MTLKERGSYRAKWDMVHENETDYKRPHGKSKYDKEFYGDDDNEMQIYCDLDGVLCGFITPAYERLVSCLNNPENYPKQAKYIEKIKNDPTLPPLTLDFLTSDYYNGPKTNNKKYIDLFYSLLRNDRNFWADLNWNPGGKEIWNLIKDHNPVILSAPLENDKECIQGKQDWVRSNLGEYVEVIIETDKWIYANDKAVLIDDSPKKIEEWKKESGVGILHSQKNLQNTLKNIQKWINFLKK